MVDDNENNRDLFSRYLKRDGYTVVLAEDGVQALDLLRSQPVSLVVLDLMMPNLDGFGVLEAMRSDEALQAIPVIVVSAATDTDKLMRCLSMGAQNYLFKPLHPEFLRSRVRACLEHTTPPPLV